MGDKSRLQAGQFSTCTLLIRSHAAVIYTQNVVWGCRTGTSLTKTSSGWQHTVCVFVTKGVLFLGFPDVLPAQHRVTPDWSKHQQNVGRSVWSPSAESRPRSPSPETWSTAASSPLTTAKSSRTHHHQHHPNHQYNDNHQQHQCHHTLLINIIINNNGNIIICSSSSSSSPSLSPQQQQQQRYHHTSYDTHHQWQKSHHTVTVAGCRLSFLIGCWSSRGRVLSQLLPVCICHDKWTETNGKLCVWLLKQEEDGLTRNKWRDGGKRTELTCITGKTCILLLLTGNQDIQVMLLPVSRYYSHNKPVYLYYLYPDLQYFYFIQHWLDFMWR